MPPPLVADLEIDPTLGEPLGHLELPCDDGVPVNNHHEPAQSQLLSGCLGPVLAKLRPDEQYCIGENSGIYWKQTNPPLDGVKAPDWFVVLGVPPLLNGVIRRSYVLWREVVKPTLVIEYVSGDGAEEHDTTPLKGKFWVYEQAVCVPFYAVFDPWQATLEVFQLVGGRYQSLPPNAVGRFPIAPLGIELGLWEGKFRNLPGVWLRPWQHGKMLPHSDERAEVATERALVAESALDHTRELLDEEVEKTKAQRERADQFAAKLRALGIDPDAV